MFTAAHMDALYKAGATMEQFVDYLYIIETCMDVAELDYTPDQLVEDFREYLRSCKGAEL